MQDPEFSQNLIGNQIKDRPLRLMMLGMRGFPSVQGGVETHAEHLCPHLVEMGCDVTVLIRSNYYSNAIGSAWKGVKFVTIWAPKAPGAEAFVHTFIGVLYAAYKRPDILHIQAIGPGIMTLLARLLDLNVVVTHHGPDYDRQKWDTFARFVLRIGENLSMRYANERIVISKVIADLVRKKYGAESTLIPNGVVLPSFSETFDTLDSLGIVPKRYVILVSRLVPEKRHFDLIDAFVKAELEGWQLVLVGGSDFPDKYERELMSKAHNTQHVVCAGFQCGKALQELFTHAGIFVLPSTHEGLPIALLEALSYGLPVIASDIPANLEIKLDAEHYFPVGDVEALSNKLKYFSNKAWSEADRHSVREFVRLRYNWKEVALQTMDVYHKTFYRAKRIKKSLLTPRI